MLTLRVSYLFVHALICLQARHATWLMRFSRSYHQLCICSSNVELCFINEPHAMTCPLFARLFSSICANCTPIACPGPCNWYKCSKPSALTLNMMLLPSLVTLTCSKNPCVTRSLSHIFIQHTDDKTLSFFRLMPDARVSASFRLFLSNMRADCQNFLLLFFTSGLQWHFFADSRRGSSCPKCGARFWSWEHFLSCPCFPVRVLVPEFTAIVVLGACNEILSHVRRVCILWLESFNADSLGISCSVRCRPFEMTLCYHFLTRALYLFLLGSIGMYLSSCITDVYSPPSAGRWHSLSTGRPSIILVILFNPNLALTPPKGIKANHYIYTIIWWSLLYDDYYIYHYMMIPSKSFIGQERQQHDRVAQGRTWIADQ